MLIYEFFYIHRNLIQYYCNRILYLIMIRPALTEKQKDAFKEQFHNIIMEASDEIKALWMANQEIIWYPAGNLFAITSGVQTMIDGKLFDKYLTLTNKVKNGTL